MFRNEPLTRRARVLRVVVCAVLFWLVVGVFDLIVEQQWPSGGDLIKNAVMAVIVTALMSMLW